MSQRHKEFQTHRATGRFCFKNVPAQRPGRCGLRDLSLALFAGTKRGPSCWIERKAFLFPLLFINMHLSSHEQSHNAWGVGPGVGAVKFTEASQTPPGSSACRLLNQQAPCEDWTSGKCLEGCRTVTNKTCQSSGVPLRKRLMPPWCSHPLRATPPHPVWLLLFLILNGAPSETPYDKRVYKTLFFYGLQTIKGVNQWCVTVAHRAEDSVLPLSGTYCQHANFSQLSPVFQGHLPVPFPFVVSPVKLVICMALKLYVE